MYTVLTVLHFVVCVFLILVVLLQAGKGGGMGIAFGGGGSQTVFGSSGAGNFLTRLTAICATIFFINSLALAYLSSQSDSKRLQGLATRKAAQKAAEKAANDQVAKDLEKARAEMQRKAGTPPAGSEGTSAPAGSSAPASGAAPATTPAPVAPATEKASGPTGTKKPTNTDNKKAPAPNP